MALLTHQCPRRRIDRISSKHFRSAPCTDITARELSGVGAYSNYDRVIADKLVP
jgi:hypothetical protein